MVSRQRKSVAMGRLLKAFCRCIDEHCEETGDTLAVLAEECGYVAMKLAQTEIPADIPMLEQINDAVQQSAEAVRAICEAVKDGIATQEERDNVDREMMEMITSFTRARARLHELPSKPVDNVTPMRRDVM